MLKAYAQWITVEVKNRMKSNDISIKNASLEWGKFYKGSKDHEIKSEEVDKIIIAPGSSEDVNSCGSEHASSGTTGEFDLYDGSTRICNIYWDCPWISKDNEFKIRNYNPDASQYGVIPGPWNASGGAIGRVLVTVARLA